MDIWALPLREAPARQGAAVIDEDRKPLSLVKTSFNESIAQFSPDGKWIAFESDESGHFEIYLQPFPGPGGTTRVSTNGGAQVRWRSDGKELFYIALDGRLMSVPIQVASNGQTIEPGTAIPLFATHSGSVVSIPFNQQYDVSPDGQRFLMSTLRSDNASPITVILNWQGDRAARENR